MYDDGYIKFYESCSVDTIRNSIRMFTVILEKSNL